MNRARAKFFIKNDEILKEFNKYLPFGIDNYFTPINFKEEKRCFFKEKKYQPQFFYRKSPKSNLRKAVKKLGEMRKDDSKLSRLYQEKKEECLLFQKAVLTLGSQKAVYYANKMFGQLKREFFLGALGKADNYCNLSEKKSREEEKISTTKAKKNIERIFKNDNLTWRVVVSDKIICRGETNAKKRTIFLKKGAVFEDQEDLDGFIAHEIYGHVYRFENGKRQPYKIFVFGFPGFFRTEEGVASYLKRLLMPKEKRKEFEGSLALYLVAADLAAKKSFRDTFLDLIDLTKNPHLSWHLTARVKRGISDTSQKGAFLKDTIYYQGMREVIDYLKSGGKIEDLYYGRNSISGLEVQKELKNLKKPQLPSIIDLQPQKKSVQ